MKLFALPVPFDRREEALLWLCGLPLYKWQRTCCYPYEISIADEADAIAFKLKFSV